MRIRRSASSETIRRRRPSRPVAGRSPAPWSRLASLLLACLWILHLHERRFLQPVAASIDSYDPDMKEEDHAIDEVLALLPPELHDNSRALGNKGGSKRGSNPQAPPNYGGEDDFFDVNEASSSSSTSGKRAQRRPLSGSAVDPDRKYGGRGKLSAENDLEEEDEEDAEFAALSRMSSSRSNNNPSSRRKSSRAPPEPELHVHLIPHSHIPHGWLEPLDSLYDTVSTILTSTTEALDGDPSRRFVWAETYFFRTWFEGQNPRVQDKVRRLVREKQLEFVGGGLVQHEETCGTEEAQLDQVLLGRSWLFDTFGAVPRVAWHMDSVGGSSDSTPSLYAKLGYDALVVNRVHFRVKQRFRTLQHLEFIWRASEPWSSDALRSAAASSSTAKTLFTHLLPFSYAAPEGFDFERSGVRQVTSPRGRASRLVAYARDLARSFQTQHVMIPWGDDVRFVSAEKQFSNMDAIVREINDREPGVHFKYSTASEYVESVHRAAIASGARFPVFSGDLAPYVDRSDGYWTGVYSSRPQLKRAAQTLASHLHWANAFFVLARARATSSGYVPRVASVKSDGTVVADTVTPPSSWGVTHHRALMAGRLTSGIATRAVSGFMRDDAAKDFLRRIKEASEVVSRVTMESLSHLLAKSKLSANNAVGPHVRPNLVKSAQNVLKDLCSDSGARSERQIPLILSNPSSAARKRLLSLKLSECSWTQARRIRVVDAFGTALTVQIHRSILPLKAGWGSELRVFMLVHVPPMGFSTYFVSLPSGVSDHTRVSGTQETTTVMTSIAVYDMIDGTVVRDHGLNANVEGLRISSHAPRPEDLTSGSATMTSGSSSTTTACFPIENERLIVEFDCSSGLIRSLTEKRGKRRVIVDQTYRVHDSVRGGGGLFRPQRQESTALPIGERGRLTISVARGPLVHQVQILGDGVSQTVRLLRVSGASGHDVTPLEALQLEGHVSVSHAVAASAHNVDTVVRYATDLQTSGVFYTDNAAGSMRARRASPSDASLASAFYPCSSTLSVVSSKPSSIPFALSVLTSQSLSCTGAAAVASGTSAAEYGVLELMLHRNHLVDEGRGLNQNTADYGVAKLDTYLVLDSLESAALRRAELVSRLRQTPTADELIFTTQASPQLAPLSASREIWLSRFLASSSFVRHDPQGLQLRITSMAPRDDVSDEVYLRLETNEASAASTTMVHASLTDVFAENVALTSMRTIPLGSSSGMDFTSLMGAKGESSGSGNNNNNNHEDVSSGSGGSHAASFGGASTLADSLTRLSEYATSTLATFAPSTPSKKSSLNAPNKRAPDGSSSGGSAGGAGSHVESGLELDRESFQRLTTSTSGIDVKRGEDKLVLVGFALLNAPGDPAEAAASSSKASPRQSSPPQQAQAPSQQTSSERFERVVEKPSTLQSESIPASQVAEFVASGKSSSEIRSELVAEEKRIALLEARVTRLQYNVDEVVRELELIASSGLSTGDGVAEKKASLEELSRAEEHLLEGNKHLAEAKQRSVLLERALDHAEALEELRARGGVRGNANSKRGSQSASASAASNNLETGEVKGERAAATMHGMVAGAGGMLVFVIAAQWFTGRRRPRPQHQAFVPVRYGMHMSPTVAGGYTNAGGVFFPINKRL